MHLYSLLACEAPDDTARAMASELAYETLLGPVRGLPGHMSDLAHQSANAYLAEKDWRRHLFLSLLLVQARLPGMVKEEIEARLDLEHLLMDLLYGSS